MPGLISDDEPGGEWFGSDNDNECWREHVEVAKECLRYALETPGAELGLMKAANKHVELALQMRRDAMSASGSDAAGVRSRFHLGGSGG